MKISFEDYVKLRESLYLDPKIKFNPTTPLTLSNFNFEKNRSFKIFVSDYDDTLIRGSAFDLVMKYSLREDPSLEKFLPNIKLYVREMYETQTFDEPVKKIESELKKANYQEKVYLEACRAAQEEILDKNILPGSDELREGLKERLYDFYVISGSPRESIENTIELIYRIPGKNIKATEFIFKNGILEKIEHMLGINKYRTLRKILDSFVDENAKIYIHNTKVPRFLYVIASDSPIDRFLGMNAGINPFILTGKQYEKVSDITVFCPEAQSNLASVLHWIDRWEVCIIDSLMEKPEDFLEVIKIIEKIEDRYQYILNSNEDKSEVINLFLNDVIYLIKRRSYRIDTFTTGLDELIYSLIYSQDLNEKKATIKNIFERLKEYNVEFFISDFREKITKLLT